MSFNTILRLSTVDASQEEADRKSRAFFTNPDRLFYRLDRLPVNLDLSSKDAILVNNIALFVVAERIAKMWKPTTNSIRDRTRTPRKAPYEKQRFKDDPTKFPAWNVGRARSDDARQV